MDSRHCHANWAWDLGGISYSLLADFNPRGAVAEKYGAYLANAGITDRATIIVDADGVVRYAESVGVKGQRNIEAILEKAKAIAKEHPAKEPQGDAQRAPRQALSKDATLYVREGCRFCASVLRAAHNLHCASALRVRDVEKDPEARKALEAIAGPGAKVPALVQDGKDQHESEQIIQTFATCYARV